MSVYLLQMTFILIFGFLLKPDKGNDSRKIYCVSIFIVLAGIAALRSYTVGVDTAQYYFAYSRSSFAGSRYEIGFIALINFLNSISKNPQLLIGFSSIIINGSVALFIYKSNVNATVAFYLYITLLTYAANLNLMRQALAMAIVLLSLPSLYGHKAIKYVAGCFLASLFHSSAIILIILLPLSYVKPSNKVMFVYLLVAALLAIFSSSLWSFISSLFGRYAVYSSSRWAGGNYLAAPIMTLMDIILFCLSCYFLNTRKTINKASIESKVLFHGAMLQILFQFLACSVNIFQRLTAFSSILLCSFVAYSLYRINDKYKWLICYALVLITALFFIVIMAYRPQWYGIVPYSFY